VTKNKIFCTCKDLFATKNDTRTKTKIHEHTTTKMIFKLKLNVYMQIKLVRFLEKDGEVCILRFYGVRE
jgi:hypothetical protein